MKHLDAGARSGDRVDVRASRDDRCAECGEVLGDEWVCYRSDPNDPQSLIRHFGGIVKTGPVEPTAAVRTRAVRSLRAPADLGAFFHPACAPRVELPEALRNKIAELLAQALVAEHKRAVGRWADVRAVASVDIDPPRCQAAVASIDGRRVFTMTRAEWEHLRCHEGRLIAIELTPVASGSVAESASVIACLAAECPIRTVRIEVWRYSEQVPPSPTNVQKYVVLDDLTQQLDVQMFVQRVPTRDSPQLRRHLREHVFIVKVQPTSQSNKARWQMKARTLERIVFKTVGVESTRKRRRKSADGLGA
jgi:hypothetical protein